MEAHVASVDTDGDGVVSPEEFVRAQTALGIAEEQARQTFTALDRNAEGELSIEEWQQAVIDFYITGGANRPGRLILGLRS